MPDPLDALRLDPEPVAPRDDFAQELVERVRVALTATTTPVVIASAPAHPRTSERYDALEEALEILHGTAPEFDLFGRGVCIANHGPMAAEALCAMGRSDAVLPRVERYRKYLEELPPPWGSITSSDWPEAIGDFSRVGEWVAFFDAELAESAWTDVLDRWVPRLAPGSFGSGTHTVLRAAHAARSLGQAETPARLHELANGLAFWAARYEALPQTHGITAGLLPSEAILRVEQLGLEDRTGWRLFIEPLEKVAQLPSFSGVADLVDVSIEPSSLLTDLTATFAAYLATNVATVPPRALVHGLTAGAATRLMLPYLSPDTAMVSLRHGWQIAAAFYGAMVVEPPVDSVETPEESIEDLIDEAIVCGDEHGIKVVEACLREYDVNPNPVYLVAARESTRALVTRGLVLD